MRVAVAGFHIESASFLPAEINYEEFDKDALRGSKIIEALKGTNTVIGGFINVCELEEIEVLPLVYAYQGAIGAVSDETVSRYTEEIKAGLVQNLANIDGVLLHLHGAAWAPGFADVERYMLEAFRKVVGEEMPIMVAFDYHGNIDADTLSSVDAAFAYHESPHIDMGETGERAANCLVKALRKEISPHLVITKPKVLTPSIFSATSMLPLRNIIQEARQKEKESSYYLDISIMAGFSYADSHNTGFSVVAVGDADKEELLEIAEGLSKKIASQRASIYRPEPVFSVKEGVKHGMEVAAKASKPVVLLEHADRMNDSSYVLDELIRVNAEDAIVPFLWDPEAAQIALQAGVGAVISVQLGGHSSSKAGPRVSVQAEVLQSAEKTYKVSGKMLQGMQVDLGLTAVLKINGVTVSVVSRPFFGVDEDVFNVFGQNLYDYKLIVLRSKTHFRQFYQAVAEEIVIIDTPDYGPADLTSLPYEQLEKLTVYPFSNA